MVVEIDDVAAIALNARIDAQALGPTPNKSFKGVGKGQDCIIEKGFDPAYGARPLRRALATLLEDKLAEFLLSENTRAEKKKEKEALPLLQAAPF